MSTSAEILEKIEQLAALRVKVLAAERKEEEQKRMEWHSQDIDNQLFTLREEYREAARQEREAAERAKREAEDRAVKQRIAIFEAKRREGIARDLHWPATVRETCYVEASDPLFRSWGLCQSFLLGAPNKFIGQGDFCAQCVAGYQNEAWRRGLVHAEKAKAPC